MQSLPELLQKLQVLHRQRFDTEREIAETEREIITWGESAALKPRRTRSPGRATQDSLESARVVVRVLQEAGEPLRQCDAIARLEPELGSQAAWRLRQALAQGYVVKVDRGLYACAPEVPVL